MQIIFFFDSHSIQSVPKSEVGNYLSRQFQVICVNFFVFLNTFRRSPPIPHIVPPLCDLTPKLRKPKDDDEWECVVVAFRAIPLCTWSADCIPKCTHSEE